MERVREGVRKSVRGECGEGWGWGVGVRWAFDALKMIITISKSASEENVLPSLWPRPLPICPLPLNTSAQ